MTMKTITLAVALCALATPAVADPKVDARVHMEAAGVAFKAGRFEDTLAELNKAYALDPQPEIHYSIGQVYIKLDRCNDAILAYENFLASKPSQDRADLANQAIAKCKEQTALKPTPPSPTTTAPPADPTSTEPKPTADASTAPEVKPVVDDRGPPPWYKDKLALGLTGGGVAFTVVGLVLYSGAQDTADEAANAPTYGESQRKYDDAKSERTTAVLVTTVGLAAIGVGVWRFVKLRNAQTERTGIAVVPTHDGGFVTYSGGF